MVLQSHRSLPRFSRIGRATKQKCDDRFEMKKLFEVIYEDDDLLVINKPAGLVCHPTKTDEYSSLISRIRLYLGKESHPQLVNRLDRETSGVTVVAKNNEVARELRQLWEGRQVRKEYLAMVHGHFSECRGVIEGPLGPDEQSRVAIKDCVRSDGAASRTDYEVERQFGFNGDNKIPRPSSLPMSRLRVVPHTGRKHQIRIHLASVGHPIVGDKIYGGDEDLYLALVEDRLTVEQSRRLILPNHALHARKVCFQWRGKEVVFLADGEDWSRWPDSLGVVNCDRSPQ